ncbi:MAG: hypothetical protein ONB23_12415 [candidate division KSB1 bacterium]|nr:hypothetical protein [candidate division KSB1 bacterium]
MRERTVAAWVLLGSLLLATAFEVSAAEKVPAFPVEQVRPGLRGVARTVFSGDQIEEMEVEVIDILRNYYPGQDVVLVRFLGPQAERIGVAVGMSGSPVYIDGRLLGAVAYRLGTFSKEPLAGVVPIQNMLPIVRMEESRAALWNPDRSLSERLLGACLTGEGADDLLLPARREAGPVALSPWPPLLVFAGFRQDVLQWVQTILGPSAPVMVAGSHGGASPLSSIPEEKLEPGSPVALVLVAGDASIEAVGTVTWRDGDQILAFGHSVFDAGPVAFPMARVHIAATIPSLYSSEKVPVIGQLIGTFYQDRLTGAYGRIGPLPRLTPVTVRCWGADAGERNYRLQVALDPSLRTVIPFYLRAALINAIATSRLSGGDYSLRIQLRLHLAGGESIVLDNFYARRETAGMLSPMEDILRSTMDVATTLASLMFNPFQPVQFDSLHLNVHVLPKSRTAEVMRIWYDRPRVRAGDSLLVVATLLTSDGRWQNVEKRIRLPHHLPARGRLTINVGGGTELSRVETRNFPNRFQPVNFRHLLEILRARRRNDRLYIQITVSDAGYALGAKELPSLPPSLLAILGVRQETGGMRNLTSRVIGEESIPLDLEVVGLQSATIALDQEKGAE